MNPAIDLTGHVYGKLTVIARASPANKRRTTQRHAFWLCRCVCGNEKVISANNLRTNNSKSCGCSKINNGRKKADEAL